MYAGVLNFLREFLGISRDHCKIGIRRGLIVKLEYINLLVGTDFECEVHIFHKHC